MKRPTVGVDGYELYAYRGLTIPYTAPAHLAVCARWAHGPSPRTERFALAELGCGDGGNLLPLAFYHPDSTFTGLDSSPTALERAREAAVRLDLHNVRFVLGDVRDATHRDLGPFDYVVAHGLYSWVPDDARTAILAFCRDTLQRDGLAYVSYNAQPGWSTRQLVRDTLQRSRVVREAPMEEKAARAIDVAGRLLADTPSTEFASTIVLADELARVRDAEPSYVFHEYLTETNDGFWLGDFVERARQDGLAYVVDAQFCRWEGYIPPALRGTIAHRGLDRLELEETLDLLGHRYFRASILCRSDAARVPASHAEILEDVYVAASLRPEQECLDLTDGVVQHFVGTADSDVTLDGSIGKAALAVLSASWPMGVRLERLYQESRSLLLDHGHPAPSDARRQLVEALCALFEGAQIDLRLREPRLGREIPSSPTVHALARWEAAHRDALTTPYHRPVAFEPPALELVRAMDGSRSRADLERAFGPELVDRTLPILERCGLLDGGER